MGSHSLPQGIFLIQGLNPGLLHCRQILYHLSHQKATGMGMVPPKVTYMGDWEEPGAPI